MGGGGGGESGGASLVLCRPGCDGKEEEQGKAMGRYEEKK